MRPVFFNINPRNLVQKRPFLALLLLLLTISLPVTVVLAQSDDPATSAGQTIFADRCANCHGATGEGDGEMSDRLPSPPAKLNDLNLLRTGVPNEWFALISNGDLNAGMPPFGSASSNPLSETQRWQAIAAVYSLGNDAETIATGTAVYTDNCAACHGPSGAGDGDSEVAASVTTDLSTTAYWGAVSDQTVLTTLQDQIAIPEHSYRLSEDELWAVVAYARRFGYQTIAASSGASAGATLDGGIIAGQVVNATEGTAVADALTVELHAFDGSFTRTETETVELDADGRFRFDLSDKPADWVYMATIDYEGVSYSSDIGRLSADQPALDLSIRVYNQTNDTRAIVVRRLHVSLTFVGDQVQVSELYTFDNMSDAVFVGTTGDLNDGTAQILLPDAAQNISFMRGFGNTENFFPAEEVIQTGNGYADTLPLRPGANSLTLAVNYTLPYADGLTFSHGLPYETATVLLAMPDSGVSVTSSDWQQGNTQMTGAGGAMLNFTQDNLAAGETLAVTLAGEVTTVAPTTSGGEWLVGGAVLLLVAGVVGRMIWMRRRRDDEGVEAGWDDDWEEEGAGETAVDPADDPIDERLALLQAIADLDTAFEDGEVDEDTYQQERARLKRDLKQIW